MPSPHHSTWDKLAAVFDPTVLLNARLLPKVRRQHWRFRSRQRLAANLVRKHARNRRLLDLKHLTCRRFCTILLRRPLIILGPVLLIAAWMGLFAASVYFASKFNVIVNSPQILTSVVFSIFIVFMLVLAFSRPHDTIVSLSVRLRREALLRRASRFRELHIEAGLPTSADDLATRIRRRREYWMIKIAEPGWKKRVAFAYADARWIAFVPLLYFLPNVMPLIAPSIPVGVPYPSPTIFTCLSPFAFFAAIYIPMRVGKTRLTRLMSSLTERTCPDCAYPLHHMPDASVPRFGQVEGLGPRSCLECGSPWPLLPPPVRHDAATVLSTSPARSPEAESPRSSPPDSNQPIP